MAALFKKQYEKLIAMDVNQDIAELFIDNSIYTPREQTLLVAALDEMGGVQGREAFVKTATLADNVDFAYFHIGLESDRKHRKRTLAQPAVLKRRF